jgi:hypothetical protein
MMCNWDEAFKLKSLRAHGSAIAVVVFESSAIAEPANGASETVLALEAL